MSYQEALEAAGATVEIYKEFGSYQGEWVAKIGSDKWVLGSYGSCSGCDAFEQEFDYSDTKKPDYQERLASFGKSYLDSSYTTKELIEYFKRAESYDEGSCDAIKFLTQYLPESQSH